MTDTTPIPPAAPPAKLAFQESALPAEPKTDVKLKVAADNVVLRERVTRIDGNGGVSLRYTYTRLDADNKVMLDMNGQPMIFEGHEHHIPGEFATRLGAEGLVAAVKEVRQIGAAKAVAHFQGMEILGDLMASRLT